MLDANMKFGTPVRLQVGRVISAYAAKNFASSAAAAKSLDISRQRLHSYMSGKSLPGAEVFEILASRWKMDLLGPHAKARPKNQAKESRASQLDLFASPIILRNDQVEVVVKRKGAGLVAEIRISASVKVA
jgi:hypothetical protein